MSNTIDWGKIHYNSWSPETNLTGTATGFSNVQSTQYDGMDAYVDCSSAAGSISADNEGTVSIWVKPNDIVSNQSVVCFTNPALTRRYIGMGLNSTHNFYVDMRTSSFSTSGFFVYANVNPFSVGVWTHLALVQDGVSPQLYVDGVAVAQTFLVPNNDQKWLNDMVGFNTINIGRFLTSDLNQNYFDGLIDEVSYFSSALSSSDMLSIYNSGVPTDLTQFSTAPVFYYRFEGTGTTATDSGTGGNDGTLENTAIRSTDVPT